MKECSYSPQRQNKSILSFLAPPYQHRPRQGRAGQLPWEERCSETLLLPPRLQTFTSPPPIPRLRRFETRQPDRRVCGQRREWPRVRTAACWSWITSPVAKCVYGLCAFAEVFFSCSHTVLPKKHSLGVIFFFSSLSSCYAVIFFNSLSSCPVHPVIYVCYVWAG